MAPSNTQQPERRVASPAAERAAMLRESATAAGTKGWAFLRPRIRQTICNFRVWLPFLDMPNRRARQVRYAHGDCRTSFTWEVVLPQQCCRCGATEGLTFREFREDVRAFDFPLHILGYTALLAGGAAFLAFIAARFLGSDTAGSLTVLTLVIVAGGLGFLRMKSWIEHVRFRMWACSDHETQMSAPDMVVYENDLTMTLPSDTLAEAARAELKQSRRGKYRSPSTAASPAQPTSTTGGPPAAIPVDDVYRPPLPPIPELPPIKLAGDDEPDLLP